MMAIGFKSLKQSELKQFQEWIRNVWQPEYNCKELFDVYKLVQQRISQRSD
jgi:hypothetical protein